MTNNLGSSLELEFQNRLLTAVSEVGLHTRLGLTAIREEIQSIGNGALAYIENEIWKSKMEISG